MTPPLDQPWNFFAGELAKALAARGLSLYNLQHSALSQDKVERLQKSLTLSPEIPVLSITELDLIGRALSFSLEELTALRAALLISAMQNLLIEYIDREPTVQIASQAYETIRANLWAQLERKRTDSTERGGDNEAGENYQHDTAWIFVRQELDQGDLALQMSRYASSHRAKMKKAREAQDPFENALRELHKLDGATRALRIWRTRYNAASLGLQAAQQRLKELEAE